MNTLIAFPLVAAVMMAPSSNLQRVQAPAYPVHTFEERWEPVRRMPPMIDLSNKTDRIDPRLLAPRGDLLDAPVKIIRTIPITRESETQSRPREATVEPEKEPEPRGDVQSDVPVPLPVARPHVRKIRTVSVDNICTRHGMRKVVYGRTWRCRRGS